MTSQGRFPVDTRTREPCARFCIRQEPRPLSGRQCLIDGDHRGIRHALDGGAWHWQMGYVIDWRCRLLSV
jgi:hypothetical protein